MTDQPLSQPGRFGHATLGVPPPALEPTPEEPEVRRRRWPRVTAAVVAALLALVAAFVLGRALGGRGQVRVWQLRRDLAAGAAVTPDALTRVRVSTAAGRTAVRAGSLPAGGTAREDLRTGQLLLRELVVPAAPLPRLGQALVGVAAAPGAAPDGIRAGSTVSVRRLPAVAPGAPPAVDLPASVLLDSVQVFSVVPAGSGSVVTLVVPTASVDLVTSLNAQSRLALVVLPG